MYYIAQRLFQEGGLGNRKNRLMIINDEELTTETRRTRRSEEPILNRLFLLSMVAVKAELILGSSGKRTGLERIGMADQKKGLVDQKVSRREMLKGAVAAGILCSCSSDSLALASSPKSKATASDKEIRPDILLIMPDQMRGDCLSILGHPAVRTPNMDKLAREGTLFRRGYTSVASCIPARYALMTGLYPQTSGVVGFEAKPFSTAPLPELMARGGYATALAGREMHQVAASGTCGYQRQILGSTYVEGDEYDKFLREHAPKTGGILKLVKELGVTYNWWEARPWPLDESLHPTNWTVAQSRKLIGEAGLDKPLFLTTSFYAPHPPLFPPKKYFDACRKRNLPAAAHGDWVDWKKLSEKGNEGERDRVLLEGDMLREAQAGYFGSIEHIDAEIGSLIADFKSRSARAGRPWMIIVTSDHGEMLGDNGYFRKCEPYEGASNIPFIIAASPEMKLKAGERCGQPVCLEDVMPTVLAAAGIERPKWIDGVNLGPILRGEPVGAIREYVHIEHAPCYSKEQAYHALTDGRWKYIWRPADGSEQLFDLETDPKEEHDRSKEGAGRGETEKWRGRLIRRLAQRPEGFSDGKRLIAGRPYHALQIGNRY